jgi:translocation and assembly module TamB
MTNSQNQEPQTHVATHRRLWLIVLSRGGMALGSLLLLGIIGGAWRLWTFVQKDLAPLAEKNLTNTLNRPIKLGGVTEFSLTGVKFAASSIPATPTDPDRVNIDAVEVGFDPLQLLFQRQLKLDVTLVNPDVYIEQDDQERWITTTIAPPGKAGPIKTDLDTLRFRNGTLLLLPHKKENGEVAAVGFAQLNGNAQLRNNNRWIKLDVAGQGNNGGNLAIQGDLRAKSVLEGKLKVWTKDLLAADVTNLIKLPLNLQAGRVNGDLQVQLIPNQPTLLNGGATVKGVTLQIPKAPQTLNNTQGNISFQGLKINLDKVTTNYGQIPLVASGTIDRAAGFNLVGRINAVSLADAQSTLKIKLPVPVSGEVKADLQIGGALANPVLSGSVATTKVAKVDKLDVQSFSSNFKFSANAALVTLTDIQGQAKIGGAVKGEGKIQLGKIPQLDFNFTAQNLPGDAIAQIYDIKSDIKIGTISATGQLTGGGNDLKTTVKWKAPEATYNATGETVITANRNVFFRNVAVNLAGGVVRGYGSYANQTWQAVVQAAGVQLTPFVNQKQLQNVSLAGAEFNGRLILSGTTAPFKLATIETDGAAVNIAGGTVAISDVQLRGQNFVAQLVTNGVQLGKLFKQIPPQFGGPLAAKFVIAGNTENISLKTLRGIGQGYLPVAGGAVIATKIELADGRYAAQVQGKNLALQQLATVPPQLRGVLAGQFNVGGSVDALNLRNIQAVGQGQLEVAGGTVTARNIQLANGRYIAQVQGKNLALPQLATVPPQLRGVLAGQFNVGGSVDALNLQNIQAVGQGQLKVAGGTVTAANIEVVNGRYKAVVNGAGVQLNRLNRQLQGQLGGNLQVAGLLGSAKLADLQAKGQLQVTSGFGGLQSPVNAAIAWNGQKLTIDQLIGNNLKASGYILANAQKVGIPDVKQLNLNIQAQNYNLQNLPVQLPNALTLAGKLDFDGNVTGKLPTPNIVGKLGFRDLVVNKLAFEPLLAGNVKLVAGQGLSVNLAGNRDRLSLNLDGNNRPKSFLVQWQQALATGQAQGDNWGVKIENFPLTVLNLKLPTTTALGKGVLGGLLTGNLQFNQQTLVAKGDIAIAKPEIGRITGDRFSTQFGYNNNKLTLTGSEFAKGNSRYNFGGTVSQTAQGPQLQAKLNISQGNIQDVLTAAQIFELQDLQRGLAAPTYGNAADLKTKPQGLPNQPLLTQIQRLYEIDALLIEQEQQRLAAKPIPDLQDLKGIFNGEIAINTATPDGLAVQFNLNGENFVWGRENEPSRLYRADKLIAEGGFEKGVLRLQPLRIESENRLIAFTGNIGGKEQSGQLRVQNFPIQILDNFVKLPVGITGNLNGTAALAGNIINPQARGELQITEGTVNQKKVESVIASFSYANGRLNFGSSLLAARPESVNINGSIPYRLPFALIPPETDQISLDVKVKDEGLALLNLLTNQVAFEKGQGEVDLTVRGTKQQPIVNGIVTLNDATFSAQALPGKLRSVTGKAQFDFDRVVVENLQGRFSRGKIEASGAIPIFNKDINIENPFTVSLDQLTLNLKSLYQGGASGKLQITGSMLNPIIGGKIELFNGQVLLAESTTPNQSTSLTANQQTKTDTGSGITKLNNLELRLGKKVKITRPPVLSFLATGDLTVNGSLTDPIPEGTISLKEGGVNVFTTQLNLVRGYKQTATFRASQPRNPDLDLRLFAKVLDVIQSSEIGRQSSTGLAALESVRVEASIKGPASKLDDNLELKSSPSRSETEIVALLGGGFADNQGRGDSTLGLINIAGSAVFNNFQGTFNQIGNAFGLSEFRLFPTVLSDRPEAGRSTSSLELALEAGVDINSKFSVSSIKILTANDPFQWGINYRINDEIRLRSSTNFTDDSRAVVEFERRF